VAPYTVMTNPQDTCNGVKLGQDPTFISGTTVCLTGTSETYNAQDMGLITGKDGISAFQVAKDFSVEFNSSGSVLKDISTSQSLKSGSYTTYNDRITNVKLTKVTP